MEVRERDCDEQLISQVVGRSVPPSPVVCDGQSSNGYARTNGVHGSGSVHGNADVEANAESD